MKAKRLGMTIILVACGGIAALALSSGQPLDRFGGLFVLLAGGAGLGWGGLRGAARRELRTRAWLVVSWGISVTFRGGTYRCRCDSGCIGLAKLLSSELARDLFCNGNAGPSRWNWQV